MLRTVLLRHDLPDGSWHYDWMLELPTVTAGAAADDPEARRLMTFRTSTRPDDPSVDALGAERLPDHRLLYLTFEGELSGGRGCVRQVARGTYRPIALDQTALEAEVCFASCERPRRVSGRHEGGDIWIFSLQ